MTVKPTHSKREKNSDAPEVTAKYYISNSKMLPEVVKSRAKGAMTNELAKMLMTLTRKYAQRPCFSGYSYKEDMISDALANLCQNAIKFNPDKGSNPFSFYTTCINNSFLQFLNVEKKHRRIRDQLLIDIGENPSFNFQEEAKAQDGGEYQGEIATLKTNIEEAKKRMEQDAIYAAAKLARDEAAAELLDIAADVVCELEPAYTSELIAEEELQPNTSLLNFEDQTIGE